MGDDRGILENPHGTGEEEGVQSLHVGSGRPHDQARSSPLGGLPLGIAQYDCVGYVGVYATDRCTSRKIIRDLSDVDAILRMFGAKILYDRHHFVVTGILGVRTVEEKIYLEGGRIQRSTVGRDLADGILGERMREHSGLAIGRYAYRQAAMRTHSSERLRYVRDIDSALLTENLAYMDLLRTELPGRLRSLCEEHNEKYDVKYIFFLLKNYYLSKYSSVNHCRAYWK